MNEMIDDVIEKAGDCRLRGYVNIELNQHLGFSGRAFILRRLRVEYPHVHFSADESTNNGVTKLILYCNPKPDY